MSITIVTRAGKGSKLSSVEHDANLNNLKEGIETLQESAPQNLRPVDSPGFITVELSGLSASLPVFSNASKQLETKSVAEAKIALGFGEYDIHEVSEFPDDHTSAGLALLDDADAAAQRTTLGLDTMATQAANNVNISGGAISGITDLAVADGGSGSSTSSGARTNFGVAIGVDVMAYEAFSIHEIDELCSVD